jgi:ABC-type Fe3+ transport system substrate-binding protein
MERHLIKTTLVFLFFLCPLLTGSSLPGVSLTDSAVKAKQESETKGYIFLATREEILAKAKKEGRLRALSGLSTALKPMAEAFRKKYPFIDTSAEEIEGNDAYQRFLLELKSGRAKGWDSTYIPFDNYPAFLPHQMKFDILGMASAGVLNIHPKMIDPVNRNTVSANSVMHIVAYNRKLISDAKVPDNWEDFLKPEFKGRKFLTDIEPRDVATLVPAWGLEKTLEFARKLAAQEPVWVRGGTRAITSMIAGEYALFLGPNFHSVKRAQGNDRSGSLGYKVTEPVPVRYVSRIDAVLSQAEHPHAALLWLEFHASPEGQKILDSNGPFQASVFTPGSVMENETRGKKLSEGDWSLLTKLDEYTAKVVEAYGFPKVK